MYVFIINFRGRKGGGSHGWDSGNLVNPFMHIMTRFDYLKTLIVTPAIYPCLVEFLHFDIHSTVITSILSLH